MCNINFCRWLDLNLRPLKSEATTLPIEPQPLPELLLYSEIFSWDWIQLERGFICYITAINCLVEFCIFPWQEILLWNILPVLHLGKIRTKAHRHMETVKGPNFLTRHTFVVVNAGGCVADFVYGGCIQDRERVRKVKTRKLLTHFWVAS